MRLPAVAIAPEEAPVLRAMLLFESQFFGSLRIRKLSEDRRLSRTRRSWIACRSVRSISVLGSSPQLVERLLTAQVTFLLMETIWKFRASWRARKSRLR